MLPPVQVGLQAPGGAPALSQAHSVPPCRETECLHPSSLHCNAGDVITIPLHGLEISCVMSAVSFLIKINRLLLPLSHYSFLSLVFATLIFSFSHFALSCKLRQTLWLPVPTQPPMQPPLHCCRASAAAFASSSLALPVLVPFLATVLSWVTWVASSNAVPPCRSLRQQRETTARVLWI